MSRLRAWLILGGALLALSVGAVLRFGPNVMKLFEVSNSLITAGQDAGAFDGSGDY